MSISATIHAAMQEEIPNSHGGCNACGRIGLPILLLREAYAPRPDAGHLFRWASDSEITYHPMHTDQLRLLRQGYVYVLLDQATWQAYAVAADATLQRFPVSQMPLGPPRPLPKWCATAGHDVIASFINIDTSLYRTAWVAFANDPWPRTVLDRYRKAIAQSDPATLARFVEVDLHRARNDPASLGIAMTDSFRFGMEGVLEFSTFSSARFTSAHGFYSRLGRWSETHNYLRTVIAREQLPNGVLALTLPDPVGMVVELNAQRTGWVQAMQAWRAQPQRHFEYFTSQALLGIQQLHAATAAAQGAEAAERKARQVEQWNDSPVGIKAHLPPVDIARQTRRNTARNQEQARDRLQARYDESARAAFQAGYDRELNHWQSMIDQVGQLYALHYAQPAFHQIARFDYDAADPVSVEYFIQMIADCLAGGPSELMPEEGQPLGMTQLVWQQLLEDEHSLLYQALMARNQTLLQHVIGGLAGDDFGKVYDIIKAIAGTPEGQLLMVKPLRDAIGQLLAATTSAGNTLAQHLSERSRTLVGHVHRAAFALYAGQHVTPLRVSLTVGEYLSVLDEALQIRTDAFLQQVDQQFRDPVGRKVRAMVLSGAINIAAVGNRNQMIDVVLWTFEGAEQLQARLVQLKTSTAEGFGALVRNVAIGAASVKAQVSAGLQISSVAAQSVASDAMRSLRDAATGTGSVGLLLALGGLWFQQDSLRRNYRALQQTHQHNPEAQAAVWSSSLGVLGASVKAAGLVVAQVFARTQRPGQILTAGLGISIARYGGGIAAMAGVMDAVQYWNAGLRTGREGDESANFLYKGAAWVSVASAGFGIAFLGASLIALGFIVFLGLAAYTLATIANNHESSLLELWARHSRWGKPEGHRRWIDEQDLSNAVSAFNAAVIGLHAYVSIRTRFQSSHTAQTPHSVGALLNDGNSVATGFYLDVDLRLPSATSELTKYEWHLAIIPAGVDRQRCTAAYSSDTGKIEHIPSDLGGVLADLGSLEKYFTLKSLDRTIHITGSLPLLDNHNIEKVELTLAYWPNRNDKSSHAKVVIIENIMNSVWSIF
ncbi:T6SS effector BTH_I2691 family protein [Pseudomonas sp. NBRC 111129]|uniref:T6SS effector BTH_I2691 family protein n=1 Tax=Pseudomonas sp. NBRC 111129 TaxID=1661044 RepID=UPI0006D42DF1|nr:T6SS effector BTH_I2691 family protein [Pseudomonas sp. NBRC 111129]